jgi:acyl-CoA synthetase (AMP-forming)/AMP-acid ligase II
MMRLPQILQRVAHEYPEGAGITFQSKTRTWQQLLARCEHLAGALKSLGLGGGGRIAILSYNSNAMAELFFGSQWVGGVVVPLNWRWAIPELLSCVEDCTPTILAADQAHVENARHLQQRCPSITTLIYIGAGEVPEGFVDYETLLKTAEPMADGKFGGDDLALIIYTGGTTGRSKGVMLSHNNIYVNSMSHLEFDGVGEGFSIVLSGPMFHISACCRIFTHTFMAVHMVILPQFDAVALMESIQKYRLTSVILISAMAAFVLDHPRFNEFDLSSLKKINYGAAPMPPSLIRRLQEQFPEVGFYHGYGATEAAGTISTLQPKDHHLDGPGAQKLRSVGTPTPYLEIRIVDTEGNEVKPGCMGEIAMRGPNVMMGYWNRPEETASVLRNGWYYSGDAGYRDKDNFLYVVDRLKDMIISGGENIYSIEVERAIDLHPAVRQCAVIGIADEKWGESVLAVLSLEPNGSISESELIAHCKESIAGYKCPRRLVVWDELPLSGAGKVLKNKIRERIEVEFS